MSLPVELAAICLCVCGEAFFSGIETGVISIRRLRLRHQVREGNEDADILCRFLQEPDRLLGTTLVGTNICVVSASIMAASAAARMLGSWGEVMSSAVMTVVLLLFGEYIPKAWFRAKPLERCNQFAVLLEGASRVLKPVAVAVTWFVGLLVPERASGDRAFRDFLTREELAVLASEGQQHGVLSPEERAMIHRVFLLSERRAGRIMVPREKMVVVKAGATVAEFAEIAKQAQFTRYPVYDELKDEYVGVVNLFDVITEPRDNDEKAIDGFMRKPLFVSSATPSDDIFPMMRVARLPMCLVRDKQNVVVGLVTTEDILAQIVGKIEERPMPGPQPISER